jgi:hypothetical protein
MLRLSPCRTPSLRSGRLGRPLLVLSIFLGIATGALAEPTCKLNPTGLTICVGPYALCDKATCRQIAGSQNVECTCPVLKGPSFASIDQIHSCTPPPGKVYSLFSLEGFNINKQLSCPAGSHYAQCWNATCVLAPGGTKATCTCPLCEGSFVTPGGNCNTANCTGQILVGGAFPVHGGGGCPSH